MEYAISIIGFLLASLGIVMGYFFKRADKRVEELKTQMDKKVDVNICQLVQQQSDKNDQEMKVQHAEFRKETNVKLDAALNSLARLEAKNESRSE